MAFTLLLDLDDTLLDTNLPAPAYPQKLSGTLSNWVELIEYAFAKGWCVVIATNPTQPQQIIEDRLRSASLPPEKYPFNLITSIENSHFSKSNPAYYAEILGNLGWPDGPLLMVGDDPVLDVDSASKAGLPVYWIRPADASLPELANIPQGTRDEFWNWIQAVDLNLLQPDFKKPEALVHALLSTPAVLNRLLRTLNLTDWTACPNSGEWALVEIVCHMRDMDIEVNLPRIETLASEENAFITGQDTDRWANERRYIEQDGPQALQDFVTARTQLVEKLKSLSPTDWQRRARHTIFGRTDLQELVGFMAEHDQTHIRQIINAFGNENQT